MGLLHKNLILASIASVAMVGFLGSSSASALDGFSFSDIINQQQAQREQLLYYLTNPFGTSTGCESSNPDSTISCNESPFPSILYNNTLSKNDGSWGHNGKGIIFTNTDGLVDGNPQLMVVRQGDKIGFSEKIITDRYADDEERTPINSYMIYGLLSDGLSLDEASVTLKINDQLVNRDQYEFLSQELPEAEAERFGFDFRVALAVRIEWSSGSSFSYPDGSSMELVYSATVNDEASSQVFGRALYIVNDDEGNIDFLNTDHQAIAQLNGGIRIRRIDANGKPVAGAKYVIEGVRADKTITSDAYYYSDSGLEEEFATNDSGELVVTGVPFGVYTAKEIYAPNDSKPEYDAIEVNVSPDGAVAATYNSYSFFTILGGKSQVQVSETSDGIYYIKNSIAEGSEDTILARYDTATGFYSSDKIHSIGEAHIKKTDNGYELYDSEYALIGKFRLDSKTGKYYYVESSYDVKGSPRKAWHEVTDYLEFKDDGSIVMHRSDNMTRPVDHEYSYAPVAGNDCLITDSADVPAELCPVEDGWMAVLAESAEELGTVLMGYHYRYNDEVGQYIQDDDYTVLTIEEESSDAITLSRSLAIKYYERYDSYFWEFFGLKMSLTREDSVAFSAVVDCLFSEKENGGLAPENIPNPQTSDAIIKVLAISTTALLPVFAIRKHLTRR